MPLEELKQLLGAYVECLKEFYGDDLKKVYLYGSQARGDATLDSDVDVIILLGLSNDDAQKRRMDLWGMTADFELEHDSELDIQALPLGLAHFEAWSEYPFYVNVNRDKVVLYDVA